ncbi:FHA domain-containing protein [Chitinophaga sp. G-6-1-13]|uniref:FHA domain-containing protein n=1 Tax=Chitinophaga fulva TaxID=2728842 RepID=A0A848GKD4_9BACT|nr:FHA domain-containing protein [Chitinophaga fulva]NML37303.1 FHA domain-containing protein [Chitinophaga fulva]
MASMINVVTKELIVLTPYYAFGRNASIVHTTIPQQDVSQSHATIFWNREGWFLRDHSRNGTLIDNELLCQSIRKLSKKHQIRFGNTESTCWNIIDLKPPAPYLKSVHSKEKVMPLPTGTDARIFCSPHHGWVYEMNGHITHLSDGCSVFFQNEEWLFIANGYLEETIDHQHLVNNTVFLFTLSSNEEHIRLQLRVSDDQLIDLGSRAHNYLLLVLARKRLADHIVGQSPEEQGWISLDELIRDISKEMQKDIDVYFINLQIFRLRKQLYEQLSFGQMFANVVERRMGEVRLGHPFFSISKGSEEQGSILP